MNFENQILLQIESSDFLSFSRFGAYSVPNSRVGGGSCSGHCAQLAAKLLADGVRKVHGNRESVPVPPHRRWSSSVNR